MVDIYHLVKLCTTTAKVLKASKGAYDAALIFKTVKKPLMVMGAVGVADAAMEEAVDKVFDKLIEENK